MAYIHLLLALLVCFIPQTALGCVNTIHVKTQAQFDAVIEKINIGEEIHLVLHEGVYIQKTTIYAKSPLYIKSKNAIIHSYNNCFDVNKAERVEDGFRVYRLQSELTPYSLFYDSNGSIVSVSESVDEGVLVNYANEGLPIERNMSAGTTIKIPIPNYLKHLKKRSFSKVFGYFDCGWQTVLFQADRSDDKFFYCKTLNNCRTGNYSYEWASYKKPVRFVIYNAEKQRKKIFYDKDFLYIPQSIGSIYQLNCGDYNRIKPSIVVCSDFKVKGVSFIGLNGIEVQSSNSEVCVIENCSFVDCLGTAIKINKKNESNAKTAIVKNCHFESCSILSGTMIALYSSFQNRNCISVTGCVFSRYPNGNVNYKNVDGAVYVDGDVTLSNNTVFNTCRDHLYLNRGLIVATGNLLYNSNDFNAYKDRNLSCDWGLIYCNHVFSNTDEALENTEHHILLEHNLLHGAQSFRSDARGIYIDDGRGDVVCRNNVILDVDFLSMDSRNVDLHNASSVRNQFEGNIVSTKYKLMGGPAVSGDNIPVTAKNVVLYSNSDNIISNARTEKKDLFVDVDIEVSNKDNKVELGRDLLGTIKKSSAWGSIKQYIKF